MHLMLLARPRSTLCPSREHCFLPSLFRLHPSPVSVPSLPIACQTAVMQSHCALIHSPCLQELPQGHLLYPPCASCHPLHLSRIHPTTGLTGLFYRYPLPHPSNGV